MPIFWNHINSSRLTTHITITNVIFYKTLGQSVLERKKYLKVFSHFNCLIMKAVYILSKATVLTNLSTGISASQPPYHRSWEKHTETSDDNRSDPIECEFVFVQVCGQTPHPLDLLNKTCFPGPALS